MPLPAPVPVHVIAHPIAHAGLWESFLALPPQIDAAIIASLVSLLVALPSWLMSMRTIGIAKASKDITEQKLFSDLLKPRMEWRDRIKAAVETRKAEIQSGQLNISNRYTNPGMDLLDGCQSESYTLFDTNVSVLVNDLVAEIKKQENTQIAIVRKTCSGNSAGELKVDFFTTDQLIADVIRALKPFLYVGHIKQTRKEAKATPRISGLFK